MLTTTLFVVVVVVALNIASAQKWKLDSCTLWGIPKLLLLHLSDEKCAEAVDWSRKFWRKKASLRVPSLAVRCPNRFNLSTGGHWQVVQNRDHLSLKGAEKIAHSIWQWPGGNK